MQYLRIRFATVLVLVCFALVSASPIAAQGTGHAGGDSNGQIGDGIVVAGHNTLPDVKATPELSSLVLFGASAAGLAGYALMRRRAGRRQDEA